jgi:PIN domain nuclease of toxin-antitoxin system
VIVLADTHALVWWLTDLAQLSPAARADLDAAHGDPGGGILVSVASRIDLHYLVKKGTFTTAQTNLVWQVTDDPSVNVRAVPVTSRVADRFGDQAIVASPLTDPWDRLILATAIELGVPLVSKDEKIRTLAPAVAVTAVW